MIKQQLLKFANSDLRAAKKYGSIGISQTKQGLVEVNFENGIYTINNQAKIVNGQFVDSAVLISGKAKEVADYIVENLYTIKD